MFIRRILTLLLFVTALEICWASNIAQIILDVGLENYVKKDYKTAADYLCQASDMNPDDPEAGYYGALALAYSGKVEQALNFLENRRSIVLKNSDKYRILHRQLSEIIAENRRRYYSNSGSDRSFTILDPLRKKAWMKPREVRRKEVPEAGFIEHMQNLVDSEKYSEAANALKQHIVYHKNCGESYRLLGLIAFNNFDFVSAVDYLKKAIRYGADRFDVNFMTAQSFYSMNDKSIALQYFLRALNFKKKDVFTRLRIADIYCGSGRYIEANDIYRDILKTNPEVTDAKSGLVYVLFEQGYTSMAIQAADEILKAEPDNANARFLKAKILLSEKKYAEASLEAESAFKNLPMNQEIEAFRALMLIREFKLKEGMAMLEDILKKNKDNVYAMAALAEGLFVSEKRKEALSLLNKADRIKKIPLSCFLRAQIFGLENKFSEAKISFGEYVDISGNFIRARMDYADFLESISDIKGAQNIYNIIITSYPGSPFAKQAFENKKKLDTINIKDTGSIYTGPKIFLDL